MMNSLTTENNTKQVKYDLYLVEKLESFYETLNEFRYLLSTYCKTSNDASDFYEKVYSEEAQKYSKMFQAYCQAIVASFLIDLDATKDFVDLSYEFYNHITTVGKTFKIEETPIAPGLEKVFEQLIKLDSAVAILGV